MGGGIQPEERPAEEGDGENEWLARAPAVWEVVRDHRLDGEGMAER